MNWLKQVSKRLISTALECVLIVLVFLFGMYVKFPTDTQPVFITSADKSVYSLVDTVQESTCYIKAMFGSGSGVYVGNGVILTAGHVVGDGGAFSVEFMDGTVAPSTLSYKLDGHDAGVIVVDPNLVSHIPSLPMINDINELCVGDDVLICGCPFGYDLRHTVTFGKVSGKSRLLTFFGEGCLIQADAQSWPGNSGGPVINDEGKLIGILVGGFRGYDGISLIVPIDICKEFIDVHRW